MQELLKDYYARLEREAKAKLDKAKRDHPERFNNPAVPLPGTTVTAQDLEKSSKGRKVSGQGDNN